MGRQLLLKHKVLILIGNGQGSPLNDSLDVGFQSRLLCLRRLGRRQQPGQRQYCSGSHGSGVPRTVFLHRLRRLSAAQAAPSRRDKAAVGAERIRARKGTDAAGKAFCIGIPLIHVDSNAPLNHRPQGTGCKGLRRMPAGEHGVHQHTHAEDVGAHITASEAELLGSGIAYRAQQTGVPCLSGSH